RHPPPSPRFPYTTRFRSLLTAPRQRRAGRPRRREEPHRGGREVTFGQELTYYGAHLAGGTDNPDRDVFHRPVPPYTTASSSPLPRSKASCATATAVSTWVSDTTTEIRISDVEIISILTPARASDSK